MVTILVTILVLVGCASAPPFDSVPENSPLHAKAFIGSWAGEQSYGPKLHYTFYDDGTVVELIYSKEGSSPVRNVYRYRVSGERLALLKLEGIVWMPSSGYSRPYILSEDKRSMRWPREKVGSSNLFTEIVLTKISPDEPLPPPPPEPVDPADNAGTIFYSYDGVGYVYLSQNVFYRCSDGKPVGYTEGGVIYAFPGDVLGFLEGSFIYAKNGYPMGAPDPKNLGMDAQGKKVPTKAGKQDLPVKGTKDSVTKPRLRNGYFGGTLADMF
jgi:hypothetical protein